jgi:hypothetical protein
MAGRQRGTRDSCVFGEGKMYCFVFSRIVTYFAVWACQNLYCTECHVCCCIWM